MSNIFTNDDIDYSLYLRETDAKSKLFLVSDFLPDLQEMLEAKERPKRVFLPWEKTQGNFDFRPGEVSIWAGQNGHGKSLVTAQIALSLVGQGQKVCMASFELPVKGQIKRLARNYSGSNPFDDAFMSQQAKKLCLDVFKQFSGFCGDKLWLYDHRGSIQHELVIGMVRYAAKHLGVDHIFIDNLAKCIKNEDDYNAQKEFIDEMMAIASMYPVHIHVVHHLKKPSKETDAPDKSDVKGSGSIVDQPDNLFLVWRNKKKEDAQKAGVDKFDAEPDAVLFCRKQRNYEGSVDGEPTIQLWFDRESAQYRGQPGDGPMLFENYPHRATDF